MLEKQQGLFSKSVLCQTILITAVKGRYLSVLTFVGGQIDQGSLLSSLRTHSLTGGTICL